MNELSIPCGRRQEFSKDTTVFDSHDSKFPQKTCAHRQEFIKETNVLDRQDAKFSQKKKCRLTNVGHDSSATDASEHVSVPSQFKSIFPPGSVHPIYPNPSMVGVVTDSPLDCLCEAYHLRGCKCWTDASRGGVGAAGAVAKLQCVVEMTASVRCCDRRRIHASASNTGTRGICTRAHVASKGLARVSCNECCRALSVEHVPLAINNMTVTSERVPTEKDAATTTTTTPSDVKGEETMANDDAEDDLSDSPSLADGGESNEKYPSGDTKQPAPRKRKKYEPEEKVFVTPNEKDVLYGRGQIIQHPGNQRYLEAKETIRPRYAASTSRKEKTVISQLLVEEVHSWGGRFLKLDEEGPQATRKWYEVHPLEARRKACQALRQESQAAKAPVYYEASASAVPLAGEQEQTAEKTSRATQDQGDSVDVRSNSGSMSTNEDQGKSKKPPRKRKKYEPDDKEFVEPAPNDVLFGRGGRINQHPGNQRYLEAKETIRPRYMQATSKPEKTVISQLLVNQVHNWGGRFLKRDDDGLNPTHQWYVVHNVEARRKTSQALREENTPESRAERRMKYPKKKNKMED